MPQKPLRLSERWAAEGELKELMKTAEENLTNEFGDDNTKELYFIPENDTDDYYQSEADAKEREWEYEQDREDAFEATCANLLEKLEDQPSRFRTQNVLDNNNDDVFAKVMKCADLTSDQAKYLLRPAAKSSAVRFLQQAEEFFRQRLEENADNLKDEFWGSIGLDRPLPFEVDKALEWKIISDQKEDLVKDFWAEFFKRDARLFPDYIKHAFDMGLLCTERDRIELECNKPENQTSQVLVEKCNTLKTTLVNKCKIPLKGGDIIL